MKKKLNLENLNHKEIPLLAYLSKEEFLSIKPELFIHNYKKGETIFRSCDSADKMYIILDGEIKISKIMSDGKEQILYIYENGDFIGGHNILSEDKYVYSAYALEETTVLTLSSRVFNECLKSNTEFLIAILEQSYERIRRAETLIDRLSVINADVKVAKLLMNMIELYGRKRPNGILVEFNITQEELGSLAGISRETMSRKLNQFEQNGIIQIISRGKILIKDENILRNLLI